MRHEAWGMGYALRKAKVEMSRNGSENLLLSVVLPVYNERLVLQLLLEPTMSQLVPFLELLS